MSDLNDDILTTHNEYTDLYDTTETRYKDFKKEMEKLQSQVKALKEELDILKDGGTSNVTPAKVIDEWLNGKEV